MDDRTSSVSSTAPSSRSSLAPSASCGGHVLVRCRPLLQPGEKLWLVPERSGSDKVALRIASSREAAEASREVRTFRCNTFLGPESSQEDIAGLVAPVAQHVLDGGNGSILFHGITGSGKSFTMVGRAGEETASVASVGTVQQTAQQIFESIRDRISQGKSHTVEVSYLQIISADGSQEKCIDLLADVETTIEVKQDPHNLSAAVCDGLRRIPVQGPDDVEEVLGKGLRHCKQLEQSAGYLASRSHCIFMLHIGSMEPSTRRGKLLFVDLAGSESLLKAMSTSSDDSSRRQALSINRTLASLSTLVAYNSSHAVSKQGSFLTTLLKDCMGGAARMLLVATIGPELSELEETGKTLAFAQQMMTSLAVRSSSSATKGVEQGDHTALLQMREKHNECIRMLKEKVTDSQEEELEERRRVQEEMKGINEKLMSRESAEKSLEELRQEQFSQFDAMRTDLTEAMSTQMEQMKRQSQQEIDALRESVAKSNLDTEQAKRDAEDHEAAILKLQGNLQEAQSEHRASEAEAFDLRVRVATAEERANLLQARQEELRKERADFDDERKNLRTKSEQQWQRLSAVDADVSKLRSEAEAQRSEFARSNSARAEDAENARKERESWRAHEEQMTGQLRQLHQKLDEHKRAAEVQALKLESQRQAEISNLKAKMERLEAEAKGRGEQLSEAQRTVASLETEHVVVQHRQDALRQQAALDLKKWQEELDDAKRREEELMLMLSEVQDGIMVASDT
eukprot:TRINITY_DN56846_c0_g1_i1.p1 TRINITY_DN56846_c0_g1~~TRINITY_DN56846_c0_g1_i1.p1  ORF type:complete len:794 (-),score=199.19 TRINITY_DN56846_c0_g1_i1:10-2235(-)